jgi:hypothetical protein
MQRGPSTFVKSTRGPDFADFPLRPLGLKFEKIFTKRSLASEKSTKIAPKLQKFISFQPQLQIE